MQSILLVNCYREHIEKHEFKKCLKTVNCSLTISSKTRLFDFGVIIKVKILPTKIL